MWEILFIQQLGVGPGPGSGQNQPPSVHGVNQQPVRFYVALPESSVISAEAMVPAALRQGLSGQQRIDYRFQQGHITAPIFQPPVVPAELAGNAQGQHIPVSLSSSSNRARAEG